MRPLHTAAEATVVVEGGRCWMDHEETVDVGARDERRGVVGLHRPAINDADCARGRHRGTGSITPGRRVVLLCCAVLCCLSACAVVEVLSEGGGVLRPPLAASAPKFSPSHFLQMQRMAGRGFIIITGAWVGVWWCVNMVQHNAAQQGAGT